MRRWRLRILPAATCRLCGCQFIWSLEGPSGQRRGYLGCVRTTPVSRALASAAQLAWGREP